MKTTKYAVAEYVSDDQFENPIDNQFDTEKEAIEWAKDHAIENEQDYYVVKMIATHLVSPPPQTGAMVVKLK